MDRKEGKRLYEEVKRELEGKEGEEYLRGVLEFYGDWRNYDDGCAVEPVDHDQGELARDALQKLWG